MIRKPLLKLGSLVLCAAMLLMPAAACAGVALEADIGYDGDLTYEILFFGRYLPNDQKHLVVEYSMKIGKVLMEMYEKAKAAK